MATKIEIKRKKIDSQTSEETLRINGKKIVSVTYWPQSDKSVEEKDRIICQNMRNSGLSEAQIDGYFLSEGM